MLESAGAQISCDHVGCLPSASSVPPGLRHCVGFFFRCRNANIHQSVRGCNPHDAIAAIRVQMIQNSLALGCTPPELLLVWSLYLTSCYQSACLFNEKKKKRKS